MRTLIRRLARTLCGVGLAGALVCGCAGPTTVTAAHAPSGQAVGQAGGGDPQSAASRAAAALLAAFRSPPGARLLPGRPGDAPPLLVQTTRAPVDPELVRRTTWWSSPGSPDQTLRWIRTHAPAALSGSGRAGDGRSGATVQELTFGFRAAPPVRSRTLVMQVTAYHGGALIRLDADAAWQPERPAAAQVPTGTTRLTVRAYSPPGAPGTRQQVTTLATVSDPQVTARVRGLVNALPLQPAGTYNCPGDSGAKLVLEFYSPGVPQPAATVDASPTGCQTVDLSVRGGPRHTVLAGAGGGPGFAAQTAALLHLAIPTGSSRA